ncbi:ABC transporter permease [Kineosporia succinea]|uniref:Peptide/nickel transport system permease protein n=1 Tax=Kineosporia succinea TaxID=84632 RepID=A0ABT9PC73_9ACTN|nr:ABC transporter permease [Kineosporia succinea]MDP9830307.1 peptide/nickel transport system permease protein [Kineosporia succinea]
MTVQPPVPTNRSLDQVIPQRTRRGRPATAARLLHCLPFTAVLFLAAFGPLLTTHSPTDVSGAGSGGPSGTHWFGTDANGLDVYSRVVDAFQLDVVVALVITAIATGVGIGLGLVTGMYESRRSFLGFVARTLARGLDIVQSIPVMIAGLVIVSFFGRNVGVITLALAAVITPFQARLMRTEVLRTRSAGYVDAARMSGESESTLLLRHVLPNSWGPTLENMSTVFAMAIIFNAALGFLGAGVPVPTPEWGSMLALGAPDAAVGRWWPVLFPALALAFSVWAASLVVPVLTARTVRR